MPRSTRPLSLKEHWLLNQQSTARTLMKAGQEIAWSLGCKEGGNIFPGEKPGQWLYCPFMPTTAETESFNQKLASEGLDQEQTIKFGFLKLELSLKVQAKFNPWRMDNSQRLWHTVGREMEKKIEALGPEKHAQFWSQVHGHGSSGGRRDLDTPTCTIMLKPGAKKLPVVAEVEEELTHLALPFSAGGKTWDKVALVLEERGYARG